MVNLNTIAVIPCYNVEKYCKNIIEKTLSYVSFLIIIDDGSTDGTDKILKQLQLDNLEKIHLITFSKNKGKGVALLEGIKCALNLKPFDVLVTIDSDGQHLPSDIPKLILEINHKADLVIGTRSFHQMPLKSRFANKLMTFLLRQIYPNSPQDTQSGFRAFSRNFAQRIVDQIKGSRYEMEFSCILLALKNNNKIAQSQIKTIYLNKNRSSNFGLIKDSFLILLVFFKHWRSKKI